MYSIQIHAEIQQLNAFTFLQKSLKNLQAFYYLLDKKQWKNTRMVTNFIKKLILHVIMTAFFDENSTLRCKQYKVHQRSKETQSKKPNMDSKEKPELYLVCSFSSSRPDYHVSPPYHMFLLALLLMLTLFELAFG